MKVLLLISTLVFSSFIYSQNTMSVANEICMPADVAKKVMMDLSRLDSTTAVLQLEKSENFELRKKILSQIDRGHLNKYITMLRWFISGMIRSYN